MSFSTTKEIITLQIGNYSNYIGAHFFNLQDPSLFEQQDGEVDHGVLWRRVLNRQRKVIWTPRVLTFDLKDNYCGETTTNLNSGGSSGSESKEKVLQDVLWHGNVKCVDLRDEEENKSSKRRTTTTSTSGEGVSSSLSGGGSSGGRGGASGSRVKSWVDYTRWKLGEGGGGEETKFSLPNFSHNPTSTDVLCNYGQGLQIYSSMEDRIVDAVRRYAEPCDYFQGFHILVDQDDGIGGLASGLLQHVADEYDKKTSFCFGVSRPTSATTTTAVAGGNNEQFSAFKLRMLNTALSWNSFNLHSTLFTSISLADDLCKPNPKPVQLPYITYNGNSAFESSYILAAALDTLTMPYRTKSPRITLNDVGGLLGAYGHKMTLIGSAFPIPANSSLFDSLNEHGLSSMLKSLTPGISIDAEKSIANFFVPRGFSTQQVVSRGGKTGGDEEEDEESRRRRKAGRGDEDPQQGRGITNAESCLEVYSQETCRKSVNVVRSVVTPFKLSHPFPVLFDRNIFIQTPRKGATMFQDSARGGSSGIVAELPALVTAHNTVCTSELLEKTIVEAEPNKKRNFVYTNSFMSQVAHMEVDDYEECINNLRTLKDTYTNELTL